MRTKRPGSNMSDYADLELKQRVRKKCPDFNKTENAISMIFRDYIFDLFLYIYYYAFLCARNAPIQVRMQVLYFSVMTT